MIYVFKLLHVWVYLQVGQSMNFVCTCPYGEVALSRPTALQS